MFQRVYINKGMRNEQLAEQRLRVARDPERLAAFERGLAAGGYEGAQLAIADVYAARYAKGKYRDAMGVAFRYLDGGDKDRAIEWLLKAYEAHDPSLLYVGRPHWTACVATLASRPCFAASASRRNSRQFSAAYPRRVAPGGLTGSRRTDGGSNDHDPPGARGLTQ